MPFIQEQSAAAQQRACNRILRAFLAFARQEYGYDLYVYQVRVARACLEALFLTKADVAICISRQAGKTEVITLLIRFLAIFYQLMTGEPLRCGIASPKGEQAKTDLDRVKSSIQKLRDRWQIEDREFSAATVRAYRFGQLHAEIFRFSLAPTTSNESKTLNLLIVEEAHLADDQKRSSELDPMPASTGGVTFFIGVGCTRNCDFYKAKHGQLTGCVSIVVPVDEVIRDRRQKYRETGDPKHLEYEKAFERELWKKGRANPEIKRNYYLEDMIEEGNFISRERFLSMGRSKPVCAADFYLGIDWARESDSTWAALVNGENDLVSVWKYPHIAYEEQIRLLLEDLAPYRGRIVAVRSDSTGVGDFPTEYLTAHSWLPMGESSKVQFTLQSKNELYLGYEAALFREPGDPPAV